MICSQVVCTSDLREHPSFTNLYCILNFNSSALANHLTPADVDFHLWFSESRTLIFDIVNFFLLFDAVFMNERFLT